MTGDDKSQSTTKFFTGGLFIVLAIAALIALLHGRAADSVNPGAPPSGLWWGLVALFGLLLATGIVWLVTGIRALFLPTSLAYRMTDPSSWFDRFTRTR